MTSRAGATAPARGDVVVRRPRRTDGLAVKALIDRCPPLDANSLYCNLLQCTHFAETSAVAERDGEIAGFVSGYLVPGSAARTIFIWQIAVARELRGKKLATQLILDILKRRCCADVRWIESTISPDNDASWRLFEGLARDLGVRTWREVMFDRHRDFAGEHDSEIKINIGPISQAVLRLTETSEVA